MILLATLILVLASVGVHYEALVLVTLPSVRMRHRRAKVAAVIVVMVAAHLLEVLLFALGWHLLLRAGGAELSIPTPTPVDLIYFSGSVYTSLGFGDIVPLGGCRLLAVAQAVAGLVLIAWTASFTVFEMSENWNRRGP